MTLQANAPPFSEVLISRYEPKVLERIWGQEIFLCETPDYLVKKLVMRKGTRGGLQCHGIKRESFHLLSGEAWVEHDNGKGEIVGEYMYPGETFDIPAGAVHRVEALTDCVFIEGSTPVLDDRYHAEADYGLDEETGGLPSTFEWTGERFERK